jgi:hypothetical protein
MSPDAALWLVERLREAARHRPVAAMIGSKQAHI